MKLIKFKVILCAVVLYTGSSFAQWESETIAQGGNGNGWAVADFNGDGAVDLTYNHLANQEILWFENTPTGWNSNLIDGVPSFNDASLSGGYSWDIDKDGDQDIVFIQFTQPSKLFWYENILDGILWSKNVISDNIGLLTNMIANLADFDGDEDFDIAIIDNNIGMVVWFENIGGAINWAKHDLAPIRPFQAYYVTVMDADRDNDADVVVTTRDSVFYFENQLPQTSWTKTTMGAALNGSYFGRGADVDNDGDLDLVTGGFNSSQVAWLDNPSWEVRVISDNTPQAFVGAVGDLDNDGDIDVVASETGGMAWFENSDNGTKWQRWTITSGAASFIVPLGGADQHGLQDLNQDGLLDVAATFFDGQGELRWYANPGVISAIAEAADAEAPSAFHLAQNYPNPFNPSTLIRYELPQAAQVQLAIYNLLGERVRTLVDAKASAGVQQVTWDGRDEHGERVSSGVYLYRLAAGEFNQTKRLMVMK